MVQVFDLDGSRIATLEDFYEEISRVLIPGAAWGHNLDAVNDILRGGFGTPKRGFVIRWVHRTPADGAGEPAERSGQVLVFGGVAP